MGRGGGSLAPERSHSPGPVSGKVSRGFCIKNGVHRAVITFGQGDAAEGVEWRFCACGGVKSSKKCGHLQRGGFGISQGRVQGILALHPGADTPRPAERGRGETAVYGYRNRQRQTRSQLGEPSLLVLDQHDRGLPPRESDHEISADLELGIVPSFGDEPNRQVGKTRVLFAKQAPNQFRVDLDFGLGGVDRHDGGN